MQLPKLWLHFIPLMLMPLVLTAMGNAHIIVEMWAKQYLVSTGSGKSERNPKMLELANWLRQHVPAEDSSGSTAGLVHGDFRMDNLVFHPVEDRVIGILDWELSTLGNQMCDVAYSCLHYIVNIALDDMEGNEGFELSGLPEGVPSLAEYLSDCCSATVIMSEDEYDEAAETHAIEREDFPEFISTPRRKILQAGGANPPPNAIFSQRGGGQFKTINDAIRSIPPKNNRTFVIFVKAGIYKEYVEIPRRVNNVVLIGEGPTKTIITGNKNFIDGIGTFKTATMAVQGDDFTAKDISFENSAGAMNH